MLDESGRVTEVQMDARSGERIRDENRERGSRLDESREGHGLGLAVVRDIIDHHRRTRHFDEPPELGGLRVTVSFAGP